MELSADIRSHLVHDNTPDKLSIAKAEFSAKEKAGIICRSTLPWASPLHMVKKKGGGLVVTIVS